MTNASPTPVPPSDAAAATAPHLRGRWLAAARIGWVAVTLAALAYYAATLPSVYANWREVNPDVQCPEPPLSCLTPTGVQTLHRLGLPADAFAWFVIAVSLTVTLGWCATGAVLFWRASADRVALLTSAALVLYGVGIGLGWWLPPRGSLSFWTAIPKETPGFLGYVCLGLFFCVFPSGRFVPQWTPWLLLAWTAFQAFNTFAPFTLTETLPSSATGGVLAIGMVAAQVYRYRRVSTPAQRQQTKWVVLGTALTVGGFLTIILVFVLLPRSMVPLIGLPADAGVVAGFLLYLPLPLGIGIAVLRYRLFDIDVIIRRTLIYSSLTAILAGVYFGVVIGLQSLVTALTHQAKPQPAIIVASTLLIAMLANPLRRQVQATIDRRFYRSKYNAARTLEAFAATLRTETDLAELSEQLVTVVRETMRPASVSLWLRESGKTPKDEGTVGRDRRRMG